MTLQQQVILGAIALAAVVFIVLGQRKNTVTAGPAPANIMDPAAWEIGPADYPGGNPSVGVPLHPIATPDGWAIDIPQPTAAAGHVHYLRVPTGALTGKTQMTLKGRLELDPGVVLAPTRFPGSPAQLTLFLQRAGDDYTVRCEQYRWWASFATIVGPTAGAFTLTARFDQNWTAVLASTAKNNPAAFQAALANAARVGFTLGGGDGLGHGAYATGPARLVITNFEVS